MIVCVIYIFAKSFLPGKGGVKSYLRGRVFLLHDYVAVSVQTCVPVKLAY